MKTNLKIKAAARLMFLQCLCSTIKPLGWIR